MADTQNNDSGEPVTERDVSVTRPLAFNKAAVRPSHEMTAAEMDATAVRLAETRRRRALCAENTGKLLAAVKGDAGAREIQALAEAEDIDLGVTDDVGNGLLHLAVIARNHDALAVLINAGLDMHAKTFGGITPLMVATVMHGDCDGAVMLAGADPDLSAHVVDGVHVLHAAAATYGKTRLVEKLLERGVSPVVEDPNGRTPLYYAIALKYDCAEVICAAGGFREQDMPMLGEVIPKVQTFDKPWDYDYLLERVRRLDREELEKTFPKHGPVIPALPDALTEEVFAIANGSGSFRMEKIPFTREAYDVRNYRGQTPLMALLDGNGDVWAARTAAWHSDSHAADDAGRTPLHYAVLHTDAGPVVDNCLSWDNVLAEDFMGRTPLMVAVANGCNYFDALVEAGADLEHKDRLGLTAMDIAKIRKSDYAVDKLREAAVKNPAGRPPRGWGPG